MRGKVCSVSQAMCAAMSFTTNALPGLLPEEASANAMAMPYRSVTALASSARGAATQQVDDSQEDDSTEERHEQGRYAEVVLIDRADANHR